MTGNTTSPDAARRKRVLLVEDEPAAREASMLFLQLQGYAVTTACDAAEALQAADDRVPDILVCDWQLGAGPSGSDVARTLQDRFSLPVIFVSAHPIEEVRAAAADIDEAAFLRKPVSLAALSRQIDALT